MSCVTIMFSSPFSLSVLLCFMCFMELILQLLFRFASVPVELVETMGDSILRDGGEIFFE